MSVIVLLHVNAMKEYSYLQNASDGKISARYIDGGGVGIQNNLSLTFTNSESRECGLMQKPERSICDSYPDV